MLRLTAAFGLALGLLASQPARSQVTPPLPDCLGYGYVTLVGFDMRALASGPSTMTLLYEYAVTLRATRLLGAVTLEFRAKDAPLVVVSPQLPVGADVRVPLGTRPGPPIPMVELRGGLRLTCMTR